MQALHCMEHRWDNVQFRHCLQLGGAMLMTQGRVTHGLLMYAARDRNKVDVVMLPTALPELFRRDVGDAFLETISSKNYN